MNAMKKISKFMNAKQKQNKKTKKKTKPRTWINYDVRKAVVTKHVMRAVTVTFSHLTGSVLT